jgi:hypothetical protein
LIYSRRALVGSTCATFIPSFVKSRLFKALTAGLTAFACLLLLVATLVTREHAFELILAGKWIVLTTCIVAALVRLLFSRGGNLISIISGGLIASISFFATLHHALSNI